MDTCAAVSCSYVLPGQVIRTQCRYPASKRLQKRSRPTVRAGGDVHEGSHEVRICTNRTCKQQGSREVLKFGRDLMLPNIEVTQCGCLGNCGNGPNLVILPSAVQVSHVSRPAHLAIALRKHCNAVIDEATILATELRNEGNAAARDGDFDTALQLYTQGIALHPACGVHLLYSNRSGVRLSQGDKEGAVEDAILAKNNAPRSFTTATVRLVDALYALGRYQEAAAELAEAADAHRDFAQTDEYRIIKAELNKKLRTKVWT